MRMPGFIAATVQEIDAMLAALRAAGRFCLVGFQALHGADIRLVKDRVVSGQLGRRGPWPAGPPGRGIALYYTRNDWAGKLHSGDALVLDGPATNALAHQITNMRLPGLSDSQSPGHADFGSCGSLDAAGPVEADDTAAIEIHMAEGPTAYFLASHCTGETFRPDHRDRC